MRSRPNNMPIALITILVSLGLAWGGSPAASGAQDASTEVTQTLDPLGHDQSVISKQLGIPVQEVVLADQLDPTLDALDAAIREKATSAYSGLYVAYEPFRVVLLATDLGTARSIVSDAQFKAIAPYVVLQQVSLTLSQMETLQMMLASSGVNPAYGSDIDVKTNQVVLLAAPGQSADLTTSLVSLGVAPQVRIDEISNPADAQATQIYGGLHLSIPWPSDGLPNDCTSGFSVLKTGGVEGMLTAGHCMNTAGYLGNELEFKEGWNGTNTDSEWFGTPGLDDMARVADSPATWRYIEGKQGRSQQHVGDNVCHWGLGLDLAGLPMQCGGIQSINYLPSWVPNATSTYIRVNANCTGGDSGGPWFKGTDAYGVHSGGNDLGGLCAYTAINYPLSKFDLTMLFH